MPNVTTCMKCGKTYEASSEEVANESTFSLDVPIRLCPRCDKIVVPCPVQHCHGGIVAEAECMGIKTEICKNCHGSGTVRRNL